MRLLTRLFAAVALIGALLPAVALAQTPEGGGPPQAKPIDAPEGFQALRDRFEGLTVGQIEQLGYEVDPVCVTAPMAGLPASYGAMGFHAINLNNCRGRCGV